MSLQDAERILEKAVIGRTAFQRFSKNVLADLCAANNLTHELNSSKRTLLKADYENALFDFRERQGRRSKVSQTRLAPVKTPHMQHEQTFNNMPDDDMMVSEDVDTFKRQEQVGSRTRTYMPAISVATVTVRVYNKAKDWMHINEKACALDSNGDLNLSLVSQTIGTNAMCRIVDPTNYHLFYQYEPGILRADDLEDLLDDGFLRVVFIH
ncbi:hypothetical protein BJ138DRAFT_1119984 [Hygrophoropsis aurantiaca]|uniref:Uncharacterized protein n=1 Tax=Hygrophoropsis aurantiaca TaxID=72124 RepID=A0ACB7ZSF1_9AGAM|nr:hypothetical protein BJ138DRAFT_1119984 [Hygrophoropsis aurantiaca]